MSDLFEEYFSDEDLKFLLNESIDQLLEQYELLKTPKTDSLKDCLEAYTKVYLVKLAEENGVEVKKSWTKTRILNKLTATILHTLEDRVLLLDEEQFELFQKFVNREMDLETVNAEMVKFYVKVHPIAVKMGLLFSKHIDGILNTLISKELKHVLNEIDYTKKKQQKKPINVEQFDRILKAAIHLYGVVTKEQVVELWKIRYPDFNFTVEFYDYLFLVLPIIAIKNSFYFVDNKLFASFEFFDAEDVKAFYEEIVEIAPIENYVPTKKEIQYYEKHTFNRQLLIYKRLKQFISKHLNESEIVMGIIEDHITYGNTLSDAIEELDEYDLLEFQNPKYFETFAELYSQLHNHTRMWSLRGYTPTEVYKKYSDEFEEETLDKNFITPIEESAYHDNVIPFSSFSKPIVEEKQPIRVNKVGRNDPCPCGSGKKYKKCCGR